MKISKQLFLHLDGAYFKVHLSPKEKKWFASNTKFKFPKCMWGDTEAKESDMFYVKIKDSTSDFSVAPLQEILIRLLTDEVISMKESNEIMTSACLLLDSIAPHFQKHERFFKITEKANLTKIVLDSVEIEEFKIAPLEKLEVENQLKPYFAILDECPASIAIRILDACDNNTDSPYDKKWVHELMDQVKSYLNSDYSHYLIKKQIREISLSDDVISLAFTKNENFENIIQLMNIIWRARNRDRDQQMINGDFYDDVDHVKALRYFLNEKNMTPKQALREINELSKDQVKVLLELYNEGLRGDHLREWRKGVDISFTYAHQFTLEYLVREQHLSPAEAVKEIQGLSEPAADAIYVFYSLGLRGEDLRNWRENAQFDELDYETLCKLMALKEKESDMSIHPVLEEMRKNILSPRKILVH